MSDLGSRWPTIPEATPDPMALLTSVEALRQSMELLTGQRGFDPSYSIDGTREILTKQINGLSATVAENKRVAVSDNAALAERTTLVEAELVGVQTDINGLNAQDVTIIASIADVDQASVTRDGALSVSLSTVTARVNDVSAGGFFKTQASVSGGVALASLEARVYTTTALTGNVSAGWKISIVGGVPYFDISTPNLRFLDTGIGGVPKQPFVYGGGKFQFTGDVQIYGDLITVGTMYGNRIVDYSVDNGRIASANIDNRTIANNSVSIQAAAQGFANVGGGLVCYLYARAGSLALIIAEAGYGSSVGQIYINGGLVRYKTNDGTSGFTMLVLYNVPYTGTHTIQFFNNSIYDTSYIVATELSK